MRPVDADALLEAIEKERQYLLARGQTGAEHILVHHCLPLIDNAPTVEARPTGKWIRKVDEVGFISHICSECGAEIEVEDCSDDKFCFNCGAKMKGGAE